LALVATVEDASGEYAKPKQHFPVLVVERVRCFRDVRAKSAREREIVSLRAGFAKGAGIWPAMPPNGARPGARRCYNLGGRRGKESVL
jgi:hypothetical protein